MKDFASLESVPTSPAQVPCAESKIRLGGCLMPVPISEDSSNPLPFQTPVDTNLYIFQQKLDTLMKNATPGDPALKTALDTYAALLQAATLERMTASLPNMSEAAVVETNGQITTLLRITERTNARYSREKRDQEAQERRIIREQQRKERQAQRELEAIAKDQRRVKREQSRAAAKRDREQQLEFNRIQREEHIERLNAIHNEFHQNKPARKQGALTAHTNSPAHIPPTSTPSSLNP